MEFNMSHFFLLLRGLISYFLEDTCIMKLTLLGILTQTNMGQYGNIN